MGFGDVVDATNAVDGLDLVVLVYSTGLPGTMCHTYIYMIRKSIKADLHVQHFTFPHFVRRLHLFQFQLQAMPTRSPTPLHLLLLHH